MLLDSSALIAAIKREPGAAVVEEALPYCRIAAVNWVEVIGWVRRHAPTAEPKLRAAGLHLMAFGPPEADIAIRLLAAHRGTLSLGDCACLATAEAHRLPVLTADRIWASLGLAVEIRLIR